MLYRNMNKSRGRMVVSGCEHFACEVIYSDSSHLFHSVLKSFLIIFCVVMVNILFTVKRFSPTVGHAIEELLIMMA